MSQQDAANDGAAKPPEMGGPAAPHTTGVDRLRDIQGGVIGFNKDHVRLLYANFADTTSAKQLVSALLPHLASGAEVLQFNALFSEIRKRGADPITMVRASWVNLLLSNAGLAVLQAPSLDAMPEEFRQGMAMRHQLLGDIGPSAPETWVAPFTGGAEPHMVLMVAADTVDDVEATRQLIESIIAHHGAVLLGVQVGEARPGDQRGHEHFGFKDGISQPGIEGLTKSNHSGSMPAGEVLLGYMDADGHVSGQPVPGPAPVPSPYDPNPAPPLPLPLPAWTRNASFVVFRRLQQDVAAFRAAMDAKSAEVGLNPGQLAAKLIGRWPSGAPMERVPGLPRKVDPSAADPSPQCPAVLTNAHIDRFDYHDDPEGLRVPRGAHIRKMNPRADVLPGGDSSARHRMIRRGITYGPEFQVGETPYGETVPDIQDRGLLFINYQASISRTFEFVQSRWANTEDFQRPGDGKDPISSQDATERAFSLPPDRKLTFASWVRTTGGAYLIAPSISALALLGKSADQA